MMTTFKRTRTIILPAILLFSMNTTAQQQWNAQLQRKDGVSIPFRFSKHIEKNKPVWYIQNATEKIKVDNISTAADSLVIQMPLFESQFRVKENDAVISGVWIKGGAAKTTVLPFVAERVKKNVTVKKPRFNITGKWAVHFSKADSGELSVGQFRQTGNQLTGTFLNNSGDYRFLEGSITGDSLQLHAFDGVHAFYFTAKITNNKTITGGVFYSGAVYKEEWKAIKDPAAKVPAEPVAMYIRPGEESLHFTFKDLEGKPVSITDEKFKDKVVVIQLMGSWCPNCMDETAFLSEYYNNNKQRGVEIIALAYEYSTDWERSLKTLKKFQQRYNVQYTILNTEVAVTDSLRTEKTLPEVTPIKFFPSSVILDKKGKIRKLDTGFNGPATGEYYLLYKKEFEETIDALLNEQ